MDREIIQLISILNLNAPQEQTSEVKNCYNDIVQRIYTYELTVGGIKYLTMEIDYEHEPHYHVMLTCDHFEACVTEFPVNFDKHPILDIQKGTKEDILESLTLISLAYPEYFNKE